MIQKGEIDGRQAFLLPNGKELSKLATAVMASIAKDDFFLIPMKPIYQLSFKLFLSDAEAKLKAQADKKGVETESILVAKSAINTIRSLLISIADPAKECTKDTIVETNDLRTNSIKKLNLRDTLINYTAYVELSISDNNFVKQLHNKTVAEKGIKQFSQFDPVMVQIAKAFKPTIFEHLGFKFAMAGNECCVLSRSFKIEADARKYLKFLQSNFPCASLKLDHEKFRLCIPNIEQRLKDVEFGLKLREACSTALFDEKFEDLVLEAKIAGCLNHAGGESNKTALHRAVTSGDPKKVQALLKAGADVSRQDNDLNTALHLAVQKSNAEMVADLLNAGADPMIKNKQQVSSIDLTTDDTLRAILSKSPENAF